ncbi:MAG: energy transducer TonB [Prevotellaceae bacterium]|jgi:protein TonB|nr:energy transducer TonB [Prevotellaceae bacterium]
MELKKTSKADLQNKKTLLFEIGLALSLLIVLVAFNWTSREKTASMLVADHQEIVEEEEQVPITEQAPPPPPEIPKILQIPDVINIVEDDVDISSDFDFSESESNDNLFQDLAYVEKKQQVVEEAEEVDEVIPFAVVEVKPTFQGKEAGEFVKWIYGKLQNNYPQAAVENNIQGVVRVSFTVNVDGTLSDIKSLRKVDPILEDCVIELVKKSPKWTPGRQQNKPVKVTYQVPVQFKLQQ